MEEKFNVDSQQTGAPEQGSGVLVEISEADDELWSDEERPKSGRV